MLQLLLSCQSTEGCADLLDDDVVLGAAGARGHGGGAGVLQRQQEAGGRHGRVGDGAVALLRADAVAVVLVGEVVAARVVVGVDVARGPREPLQAVLGRPPLRRAAAHAHYRLLPQQGVTLAPDLRHPDGEGGGALGPVVGEHVAVLPGGDDHVVAGVGAADGGRAARVTRHPELGLETLGAAWAEDDTSAISYVAPNQILRLILWLPLDI